METAIRSSSNVSTRVETDTRPVLSGIVTGQIAGLIMAVVVMLVFALFLGKGPLYPVQVIGSALFGASALQGFHFGALIAGLLMHQLGPSLLWGVVYGLLAKRFDVRTGGAALVLGLALGVFSMVGPYFLIPFAMKSLHGVDYWNQEVPMIWDWAAHLVFGASFTLYPKVLNKIRARAN